MNIGYARVSSKDQKLEIQKEKLSQTCEKIFEEKKSGTNCDRPELLKCLEFIREGDTLVICKLDRLARSLSDLLRIKTQLEQKKIELKVLDQNIDTTTSTGRLLFHVIGAIAEFENEIRKERQAEGILNSKGKITKKRGKKLKLDKEKALVLLERHKAGATIRELEEQFEIKKSSIYNYLDRQKTKKTKEVERHPSSGSFLDNSPQVDHAR